MQEKLEKLKNTDNFRYIKDTQKKTSKYIFFENIKMLNLSSNDYLNLSTDEALRQEFIEKYSKTDEFLFSSTSARLLSGNLPCYQKLENNFAKLFKKKTGMSPTEFRNA
jgi:8-amino-7-oxononanoate synthase